MEKDKIESLLGFAVKAGFIVFGTDNLLVTRKKIYLIFCDGDVSKNTFQRITAFIAERKIPLYEPIKKLEEIIFRKNCKVIGLTDKQMALAMQKNLNSNYKQIVAEGI